MSAAKDYRELITFLGESLGSLLMVVEHEKHPLSKEDWRHTQAHYARNVKTLRNACNPELNPKLKAADDAAFHEEVKRMCEAVGGKVVKPSD